MDSEIFSLVILPILIFIARVTDVTLGTVRIIFISRGRKFLAPIFGFFEVTIWLLAISQIMQNLTNIIYYLAFAAGYSLGNLVGILVEEKIALGTVIIRIIARENSKEFIENLRSCGYDVIVFEGQEDHETVNLLYTIIERKDINELMKNTEKFSGALLSIDEIRLPKEGIIPRHRQCVLKSQHK